MVTKTRPRERVLFIGRWQPFHHGHKALIEIAIGGGYEPVIGIRDTPRDRDNPYTIRQRKRMIRKALGRKVLIVRIPDITQVWVGRDVGYKVIQLSDRLEDISGTDLREELRRQGRL